MAGSVCYFCQLGEWKIKELIDITIRTKVVWRTSFTGSVSPDPQSTDRLASMACFLLEFLVPTCHVVGARPAPQDIFVTGSEKHRGDACQRTAGYVLIPRRGVLDCLSLIPDHISNMYRKVRLRGKVSPKDGTDTACFASVISPEGRRHPLRTLSVVS